MARLLARYRSRFWPRSRRLLRYTIRNTSLEPGYCGQIDYDADELLIDAVKCGTDRHVRSTVLHEMIHAVVGQVGHGARLWEQLEYLLSKKAPITVGIPELGEHGGQLCVIPKRFRRARKLFRSAFERAEKAKDREGIAEQRMTLSDFEHEFEDVAAHGADWRTGVAAIRPRFWLRGSRRSSLPVGR